METASSSSAELLENGANSRSIVLIDINCDDVMDVAWLNATVSGFVTGVINNGNATFGPPTHLYAGDLPADLSSGDFNGDGLQDLIIAKPYWKVVAKNAAGSSPASAVGASLLRRRNLRSKGPSASPSRAAFPEFTGWLI